MKFQIAKEISFDLPEGDYSATLSEVFTSKKSDKGKEKEYLRLVFQIKSFSDPRHVYHAGKNYYASDANKLANDLKSWLGDEFDALVDKSGVLSTEKIEALIDREADIEIEHIINASHDEPFRHIKRILPAGELVDNDIAA